MAFVSSTGICTIQYTDEVATGIEFIASSEFPYADTFGKDGQAYFCIKTQCCYIKVQGRWIQFNNSAKTFFFWCPSCHRKHESIDKLKFCSSCGGKLLQLDITREIFTELDDYCTKTDIVGAALGKIGGL